ncbi:MAG: hypothetical protein ACFE85_12015 [Candidatus Hodarchaeota archaeon]
MSLQECLANRKDCSGGSRILTFAEIKDICKSAQQGEPSKDLIVFLPNGPDYTGGIYTYHEQEFAIITDKEQTKHSMEVYPELIWKKNIELKELISTGLIWQYLSLKAGSIGLGVSQRARPPKKENKLVNSLKDQNYLFLYSFAVRERDHDYLLEDSSDPLQIELEEGIYLLDTPECYKNRAVYDNRYEGVPLENAIFNQTEKKNPDYKTLNQLSQMLWACQGENDHATHGNRDPLEKNGYARVHASGCAGYAVYPIIFIENLANLPKGGYIYNPIGFSALNRWININENLNYDHFIQIFTLSSSKAEIEREFSLNYSNFIILLCIDREKPCSGFMHSKIGKTFMNTKYWAEIEAGMALAGLQLQANALGLKWQKTILSNPNDPKYRSLFKLDLAELKINEIASNIINLPKNEKFSLKGNLVPTVLFTLNS